MKKNIEDVYKLSPVQQGILFHTLKDPEGGAYHDQFSLPLEEELDAGAFRRAWQQAVERTPVLRTFFLWEDLDEPVQVVAKSVEVPFEEHDLSALAPEAQRQRIDRYMEEDRRRGFELSRPPLTRLALFRLSPASWRLVWSYHHLLLDGWSAGLMLQEVTSLYAAAVAGSEPMLPPRRPFKELIAWLRRQDPKRSEQYWRDALAGAPAPTMPAAARPVGSTPGTFVKHQVVLPPETTEALTVFAKKHRVTLPTLTTAAFAVALARAAGEERPLFGLTVSGRPAELPGVETMVGCFINTLPFSPPVAWNEPVETWLRQVQTAQVELRKHEASPLVEVRKWAGLPADRPPFEAILVFESFGAGSADRSGGYESFQRTNYPLTVGAMPLTDGLRLAAGIDESRFSSEDGLRFLERFRTVLEALPAAEGRPVRELPALTSAEQGIVWGEWSGTPASRGWSEGLLHRLVEERAAATPEAVAAVFEDEELSYGDLVARGRQIARRLAALGVGPETVVGICLDRSFDVLAAILGVLQAGAAYLPLDPAYPAERLTFMVEDSAAPVVLATGDLASRLPAGPRQVLLDAPAWQSASEVEPAEPLPSHPAYVIYTSGSTGRPKGVVVCHAAAAHRIRAQVEDDGLSTATTFLQKTSLSFDVSVAEIFAPLAASGRVVLAKPGGEKDAVYLARLVPEAGITHTSFPPTLLKLLLDDPDFTSYRGLAVVATGGETVPPDLPERFYAVFPETALENRYGPTEATVSVTRWVCRRDVHESSLPIGRPIADARVYVVDRRLDPVPPGVAGEVLLGGPCLARGYLARPGRTAEAFVPNPFSHVPGERLYRTGDLVRFRPDGVLDFVGRVDRQVKIRGFRVELGEVEAALVRQPGVREAVVVDLLDETMGSKKLAAYVVPEPGEQVVERTLRADLGHSLPEHMVPAAVVVLDSLPLGATGKVDRARLPAPTWQVEDFVPPATPAEEIVAGIWSEVLEVERVGATDDFFDLGGHSLLVTRILSRVRDTFGVELPLKVLFEASNVRDLAAAVEAERYRGEVAPAPPVEPVPRDRPLPLSFGQERLWFLDRLAPGAPHYVIPAVLRLAGRLRSPVMAEAVSEVARRHESLRTRFHLQGRRPVQVVAEPPRLALQLADLSALALLDRERQHLRLLRQAVLRGFDLEGEPLLAVRNVTWDGSEHALVLSVHHVAADAWSMGIVIAETGILYRAFLEGRPSPLPELPLQYGDYAAWQRGWLSGQVLEHQLAYWRERLEGAPGALDLLTDRPRPPVETFRGKTRHGRIGTAAAVALKRLARESGATLFMTGLAAFFAQLARETGQTDILLGTPAAHRGQVELEEVVGLFLNTLVLRARMDDDPTFHELLARVRDETLGAFAHQDLPFEKLVAELEPERNLSRSPFFQAMFVLQTAGEGARVDLPGLEPRPTMVPSETAKFDLTLSITERDGGLFLSLEYNRDLFDPTTVDRLLRRFERLAGAVAEDAERPLSALPLLAPAERHQLLAEWNDTTAPYPAEATLPALLDERSRMSPERQALAWGDVRWTYAELFKRARRLARRLAGRGIGPETRVGILLERSAEMVVAALAVMEAGGAYVPLDPAHPAERLGYVLGDSGAELLVSTPDLARRLGIPAGSVVTVEGDGPEAEPAPVVPQNLAYVLYTSGSTGKPKGVEIPHRALVNFLTSMADRPGLGPGDTLLAVTTLGFDIAGLELYLPLLVGARLVLAPAETVADGPALLALLRGSGATMLQATPATWRLLLASGLDDASGLTALCGGEALPRDLAERLLGACATLWNLYGPTETTIWSAVSSVAAGEAAASGSAALGRPIANTRITVIDPRGRPVPTAVAGELAIAGDGLARGYHGRPALTAERFVPDAWSGAGERAYRTGDLARWLPGGTLEYLGRLDHQVKVRGFRIELGEIESVLEERPEVDQAVVVARRDRAGDPLLVAWVVGSHLSPDALRGWLADRLPPYMVPAAIEPVSELPLTPNGKVDRKALAARASAGTVAVRSTLDTAVEREVAAVWREVLEVSEVGPDDSFFELGGHSLLLIEVHARLTERLGRDLAVADLFRYPTVRSLARFLTEPQTGRSATARRPVARPTGSTGIAVVGMAARFPGARDLAELWELLTAGREGITFYSDEELAAAGVPAESLADPRYVKARGDLEGRELFDADFFGYTPREAQILDPQQRLFLETAWQAVEGAGYDPGRYPGRIGVFAGMGMNTYLLHLVSRPDLVRAMGRFQTVIANDKDFLPSRVAYKLDLKGPAINVQTACSTSLVAVALACENLLAGRSDMALAGGVTVHTSPPSGYWFEEEGIASPDGHTRTFDATGRGTVASSGCGAVLLKRLDDALADGDTIHAVIKGFALNNDGAMKVGYTAPSVEGQAAVIREALDMAGVDPGTIGYVEAHGTATPLGDPIELTALAQAFGADSALPPGRVEVGSIKSNLGHTDAAAGVAGLIKAVLSVEHGKILPSLHFERPNPKIDFGPFTVPTAARPWEPENGTPRRAAVSSFGIGGTNAHLVLEEAPAPEPSGPAREAELLVISARSKSALETATGQLAGFLVEHPETHLGDLAYTLQAGRKRFGYRRAVVVSSTADAAQVLADPAGERVVSARQNAQGVPVVFLFPGGGAQYPEMARGLYRAEPVFRQAMEECAAHLAGHVEFDLRDLLYGEAAGSEETAAKLRRTSWALPALFAVEYALAKLWISWDVVPRAMIGHSLGEYVAACLAGVLSLPDALALVALRGELFETLPAGAMLSVACPPEEIEPELPAGLSIAAVNTPGLTAVSGPVEAVEALAGRLEAEGVEARLIHIEVAAHSPMVEPILDAFAEAVQKVELRAPEIPYLSNVTGTWMTAADATDPSYWPRHLRRTVRFAPGLSTLFADGFEPVLLEVGPGQTLATLARQHPGRPEGATVVTSLRHPKDEISDVAFLAGALGKLWLAGADADFSAHHGAARRRRIPLPTYPFERQRYWIDAAPLGTEPALGAPVDQALLAETAVAVEEDELPLDHVVPRNPTEEKIAGVWREILGVSRVGVHDDFFELGGSSLLAMRLGSRLRQAFGSELPAHFLLDAPTVARQAELLAPATGEGGTEPAALEGSRSCLVRLAEGNGKPPLFLVHPVGGHVYFYRELAAGLDPGVPVFALRARGSAPGEEPFEDLRQMAAFYLSELRRVAPCGPYRLGGSSMGGLVAYEMAQQIVEAGDEVDLLALLDTTAPSDMPSRPQGDAEILDYLLRGRLPVTLEELSKLSPDEQLSLVLTQARETGALPPDLDLDGARRLVAMVRSHLKALFAYQPYPYRGKVLFFRAGERQAWDAPYPERAWIELAQGGIEIQRVPGDHISMHHAPNLPVLVRALTASLARLPARAGAQEIT